MTWMNSASSFRPGLCRLWFQRPFRCLDSPVLCRCAVLQTRGRSETLASILQVFDAGSDIHMHRSGVSPGMYKHLVSLLSQPFLSLQSSLLLSSSQGSCLVLAPNLALLTHSPTHLLRLHQRSEPSTERTEKSGQGLCT